MYLFTQKSSSNDNQSGVSDIEQKKIKLNRTKIYSGRDIMIPTDELDLCYDGNILSNKEKLLKIGDFLGLKPKLAMRYQITVGIWWIWR